MLKKKNIGIRVSPWFPNDKKNKQMEKFFNSLTEDEFCDLIAGKISLAEASKLVRGESYE